MQINLQKYILKKKQILELRQQNNYCGNTDIIEVQYQVKGFLTHEKQTYLIIYGLNFEKEDNFQKFNQLINHLFQNIQYINYYIYNIFQHKEFIIQFENNQIKYFINNETNKQQVFLDQYNNLLQQLYFSSLFRAIINKNHIQIGNWIDPFMLCENVQTLLSQLFNLIQSDQMNFSYYHNFKRFNNEILYQCYKIIKKNYLLTYQPILRKILKEYPSAILFYCRLYRDYNILQYYSDKLNNSPQFLFNLNYLILKKIKNSDQNKIEQIDLLENSFVYSIQLSQDIQNYLQYAKFKFYQKDLIGALKLINQACQYNNQNAYSYIYKNKQIYQQIISPNFNDQIMCKTDGKILKPTIEINNTSILIINKNQKLIYKLIVAIYKQFHSLKEFLLFINSIFCIDSSQIFDSFLNINVQNLYQNDKDRLMQIKKFDRENNIYVKTKLSMVLEESNVNFIQQSNQDNYHQKPYINELFMHIIQTIEKDQKILNSNKELNACDFMIKARTFQNFKQISPAIKMYEQAITLGYSYYSYKKLFQLISKFGKYTHFMQIYSKFQEDINKSIQNIKFEELIYIRSCISNLKKRFEISQLKDTFKDEQQILDLLN